MGTITNRLFDEIAVGETAVRRRRVTEADLYVFAAASGNLNPMHLPDQDGDGDPETPAVAPSLWLASLPSALLGMVLPGPGTLYRAQGMTFHERARVGDELVVTVTVVEKRAPRLVLLDVTIDRADGKRLADGTAEVYAPERRLSFHGLRLPKLLLDQHDQFARLISACGPLPPLPTAVVWPDDPNALNGVRLALEAKLIAPILVGDPPRMTAAAAQAGLDIGSLALEGAATADEAAHRAVALVHAGRARALMKGSLHTDTLLAPIVQSSGGLRTPRRMSHVFVMDVPGHETLLLVTDAAVNIAPDLDTKVDIVQNAIDLGRALGIATPKVGILSAVETVNPKIPSTLDAAILSKMAERGQITGGIVDGPLAMDNAVDLDAARTKGIRSLVAGRADVLVAPNLEAGNILAKELTFLSGAEAAGIVVGAKVPVMLTSRADADRARLGSSALAVLMDHWQRTGQSAVPTAAPDGVS